MFGKAQLVRILDSRFQHVSRRCGYFKVTVTINGSGTDPCFDPCLDLGCVSPSRSAAIASVGAPCRMCQVFLSFFLFIERFLILPIKMSPPK